MKSNVYLKVGLSTLVLFVLGHIQGFNVEILSNVHFLFWKSLSDLLIVLLLAYYILNSSLFGMKLALSVFAIFFIIGNFNILIEAYIFNVTDRSETGKQMIYGFMYCIIASFLFVKIFDKWQGENVMNSFEKRNVFSWIWRVFVGIILYIFLYLLAGFILQAVYPELLTFYQDKIPSFDVMIGTQVYRGLIFCLIAMLILRTLKLSMLRRAIYIGLVFAILGGIAPLIIPSELMPRYIRMGHLVEVGTSNFLYGFILSFLLRQKSYKTILEGEVTRMI